MLLQIDRQWFGERHEFVRAVGVGYWTLEITLCGRMRRRCGKGDWEVQRNRSLVLTPPGVGYELAGEVAGDEVWVLFNPRAELRGCLGWPTGVFGVGELELGNGEVGERVIAELVEAERVFREREGAWQLLAENGLERALILASGLTEPLGRGPVDERIEEVMNYVKGHWRERLTVGELARRASLSASRFAHLFHEQTGRSVMGYVEELRLAHAQHLLLRTRMPVKQIAREAGFEDAGYFGARFRRRFGRSPRQWRQNPRSG